MQSYVILLTQNLTLARIYGKLDFSFPMSKVVVLVKLCEKGFMRQQL